MRPSRPNRTAEAEQRERRRQRSLLVAIFCTALLVRVFALIDSADNPGFTLPTTDAGTYDMVARDLSQSGSVDDHLFWQAMLYPLQLSLVYALSGGSIVAAKAVQAVIGALTCCLVFLIAARRLGRGAGLLAAAITAGYGPLILFEGELLAAGSAAFWTAALIYLFDETEHRKAVWLWPVVGVISALATLMRPTFLPFVVAISAWQLVRRWRQTEWRQAGIALLLGVLTFTAVALPVVLWNGNVTGRYAFLPASGSVNFHLGNNPEVCETLSVRPGFAWERLMAQPAEHGVSGPGANSRYFTGEVLRYLQDDPVGFATGLGRKFLQLISAREIPRNLDVYLWSRWSDLNAMLTWKLGGFGFPFGLLLPMAVLGMIYRGRRLGMPLMSFVVLYGASIVLVFVTARYRVPMIPALAIVASAGVLAAREAVQQRQWPRIGVMALVVAGTVSLATLPGPFCEEQQNMEADFYGALGTAQFSRDRFDEAYRSFSRALDADPTQAQTHYNFGLSAQLRGELSRAVKHYRKAIRLEPGYAAARSNLATLLAHGGNNDEAIFQYRESIRYNPLFTESYRNLIKILIYTNQAREALALSDRLVAMESSGPADMVLRSQAFLMMGDSAAAVEVLREAIAAGADEIEARLKLGIALLSGGDVVAGLRQFERLGANHPDNALAYLWSGISLSKLEKFPEAKARLETALSLAPRNIDALLALARARLALGDRAGAANNLRTLLDQQPDHGAARALLEQVSGAR